MIKVLRKFALRSVEVLFFKGRSGIRNADAALRYLPISDMMLREGLKNPSILEVGSGSTGITPYVPYRVTGVDVSFEAEVSPRLDPVVLSSDILPFSDSSFDYVVSVDMLEHVLPTQRPVVISELLRVARRFVFLAVPCGNYSEEHDRILDEAYRARYGVSYHFLTEHVENGLPDEIGLVSEIENCSKALGKKVSVTVLPNVNLGVRECFMRLWILSPKVFTLISPFICIPRRFYDFGKSYRRIFVVKL